MRLGSLSLLVLFAWGGPLHAQEMPALTLDKAPETQISVPEHNDVELIFGDAARAMIYRQFHEFDPDYYKNIVPRRERFDELALRVFEAEKDGRGYDCSRQIFVEVKWLVGYTAWWSRMDQRMDELEGSLDIKNQSFATKQDSETGLWGRCTDPNFIKIEASLEQLFLRTDDHALPAVPVEIPDFLGDPESYENYLLSLIVSDIPRTGENMRSRLGSITGIHVAVFKKRKIFEFIREAAGLLPLQEEQGAVAEAVLRDFVFRWQDPVSGYWGAWYKDGDKYFKTADLSLTYHIIHARRGDVNHWPQIIETTLAMRDQPYPFGWISGDGWTNHNNYDLVRIFAYGWQYMTPEQQAEVASILQDMLDWCFENTVLPSYRGFILNPELSSSVGAELYFGVSFLDAIGFFDGGTPWEQLLTHGEDVELLCQELYDYAVLLTPETYVVSAERKLERACGALLGDGDGTTVAFANDN